MAKFKSQHFRIAEIDKIKDQFNLGLLYYKYTPLFEQEMQKFHLDGFEELKKTDFLKLFSRLSRNVESSKLKKRLDAVKATHVDGELKLSTQSRFICGTGYQSRAEWGFSFDWTTGIPYLPGSSWKGALLSYLEFSNDNKPVESWNKGETSNIKSGKWTREKIFEIFGPQGNNKHPIEKADTGRVVFFDAFPLEFRGFEVDIITPHYKPYYENPENNPPADIYSPVPIPFLTLPVGTSFSFCFKFRNSGATEQEMNNLKSLIEEVGINYGFGAKTATGYGYFERI